MIFKIICNYYFAKGKLIVFKYKEKGRRSQL